MQKSFPHAYRTLLISLLASILGGGSLSAAAITWGTATTISADSEILTTGPLVYAYHFTQSSTTDYSINGVTFTAFPVSSSSSSKTLGFVTVAGGALDSTDGGARMTLTAPINAPSIDYQLMLGGGIIEVTPYPTPDPYTLTLGGLTIGQSYRLQIWSNNSDSFFQALPQNAKTVLTAGNSATLDMNSTNNPGGLGQWVIGTFTANATTQTITIDGLGANDFAVLNAVQLRLVPEPSVGLLLGGGGLAFSTFRRRKVRVVETVG